MAKSPRHACKALAALSVAVALIAAPLAHADGDPASDVLLDGNLFPSYDGGITSGAVRALAATIDDSKTAGYQIRVAIIAKPDDLGAVTALWAKPKQYARFLGIELGFIYKGPVLIVMPNGIGFSHGKKDTSTQYAALRAIRTSGTGDTLAQAAIDAISTLAADAGHPITPHTIPATRGSNSRAPLLLVWLIAVLVLGAVATVIVIHRRGHH